MIIVMMLACLGQGVKRDCGEVLKYQTIFEQSDYQLIKAYLKVNASEAYQKRKMDEDNGLDTGGSWGPFDADYRQSSSASEFEEKVDKRLTKIGFNMSKDEAKTYSQKYLDPVQVAAWANCMGIETLTVWASDWDDGEGDNNYTLHVVYFTTGGDEEITVRSLNRGTRVDNRKRFNITLEGSAEYEFLVTHRKNKSQVSVQIGQFSRIIAVNMDKMKEEILVPPKEVVVVASNISALCGRTTNLIFEQSLVKGYVTGIEFSSSLQAGYDTDFNGHFFIAELKVGNQNISLLIRNNEVVLPGPLTVDLMQPSFRHCYVISGLGNNSYRYRLNLQCIYDHLKRSRLIECGVEPITMTVDNFANSHAEVRAYLHIKPRP